LENTDAVAAVVKLCREHGLFLIPQGGNTGLVLGSSSTEPASVILSLERLNSVGPIDPVGKTVRVESGVVLDQLQSALADLNLTLPLHLGSGGSAQIGGLISTNAGGCHAFRHGMMADQVLGLEVVLPDGKIWNGNRALIKDNAGYALRRLFCGAEGSLGVVTSATLRLIHKPADLQTMLLACDSVSDALSILSLCESAAGSLLNAAEFIDRVGLELLKRHQPHVQQALDDIPNVALLIELASPSNLVPLGPIVESILESAMDQSLASDGVIANNEQQRQTMWTLRESIPEGQRLHGAQLKHDIAIPVASLAEFLEKATQAVLTVLPTALVNPFGHLADGNVHFNLSAPAGQDESLIKNQQALNSAVYDTVVQFEGSIAAEHGLGRSKVRLADSSRSVIERTLMKSIKRSIDPDGRMNPDVILAATDAVPNQRD